MDAKSANVVARNIATMQEADATDEEIDAYVAGAKAEYANKARSNYTAPAEVGQGGTILNPLLAGAMANFDDEALGAVGSDFARLFSALQGNGPSEIVMPGKPGAEYDFSEEAGVASVRQDKKDFAQRNPILNTAATIAGAIPTLGTAGTKVLGSTAYQAATPLIKAMAIPAVAGLEGMLYGAGEGENPMERVEKAGEQGMTAAMLAPLFHLGATKLADVITPLLKGKKAVKYRDEMVPRQDFDSLKANAQKNYQAADDLGITVSPKSWDKFKSEFDTFIKSEAIDGRTYPGVGTAIRSIKDAKNPTLREINAIKTQLRRAKASRDSDVSRVANDLDSQIDEYMDQLDPSQVVSGKTEDLSKFLGDAKQSWHKMAQVEQLEDIQYKALLSEANIDAGDMDKAVRSGIRSLLLSPKKRRGMDEEYIKELESIIKGGPIKNAGRWLARMAPGSHTSRGTSASVGSSIAGVSAFGPAGIATGAIPSVVGGQAQDIVNKKTQKQFQRLVDAIANSDQPGVDEIISAIIELNAPGVAGAATAAAASSAGDIKEAAENAKPGTYEDSGLSLRDLM